MVEQQQTEDVTERNDVENIRTVTRRFRYSTTFTLPRHETIAIQQLLMHYPLMAGVLPPPRRRRSPASFRRTVYRHNLWARPLPDFTGRFRDSTPDFYRYNDTQMHRLVPWLNRELSYLLNDNVGHISYVMARVMDLLPQYHITSPEFREAMRRYFGDRTEHFLHELYCFASTPYDMTGYDRNVQYTTDSRISTMVNEVISSSESDASVDSDIVMVSSSEPAEQPAGPSGVPPPAADNVIPIETISHSDTDDDSSEVMVVGYIKPPQERTPEVVDLLGSDSDVVVQEGRAEPPPNPAPAETSTTPLVKLILKRQPGADRSDSDDSDDSDTTYRPPCARRRRRPRSHSSSRASRASHVSPPSPTLATRASSPASSPASPATPAPRADSSSPATAFHSSSSNHSTEHFSDTSDSDERCTRFARRKTKKRISRDAPVPRRERKRSDRRPSRNRRVEKVVSEDRVDRERRNKRKSHTGKGVKSSKRREESAPARARSPERAVDYEASAQAGPSGSGTRRRRRDVRQARSGRRLRSVVNVMCGAPAAGAWARARSEDEWNESGRSSASRRPRDSSSDSDDNLPLNLTVQKAHTVS
ncbi:hypothetical protein O3G_MSEX010722 [Manduca sexta]|nr:hypothetical protein O3G_MSEX010722 [Manduca sexta]